MPLGEPSQTLHFWKSPFALILVIHNVKRSDEPFRDNRGQMGEMGVSEAKNCLPEPLFLTTHLDFEGPW